MNIGIDTDGVLTDLYGCLYLFNYDNVLIACNK